jgi:quinol monooxygenase YgiN
MKTIKLLALVITLTLLSFFTVRSFMQEKPQVVRIAKISVDPARLNEYKAALKEGIETAVRTEPGVLSYQAVSDKLNPANITILEVYANIDAYQSHIETPHFKKYKTTTQNMVVSLDLVDVEAIDFVTKE